MRSIALLCLAGTLALTGCIGPVALHEAVLGYDESISRLDREMLLVNIARKHNNLPGHFTITSSIAATFDYRASAGFTGTFFEAPGINSYGLSLGASVAENPTLSIIPIQGEEFTKRVLTPMDESKFEFLLLQGVPLDMVMRLMGRGIEFRNKDGTFRRFVLNSPARPEEYKEFRRRTLHLAWLNARRKLFVGTVFFEASMRSRLAGPPSAADLLKASEKGYQWRRVGKDGMYELTRRTLGRVLVTNYDPRTLSNAERRTLNALASSSPKNFVLVDVRPGRPGGDYPLFGAIKLRSLNLILQFLADEIRKASEFDVEKDPRTGNAAGNPRRTLAIQVSDRRPPPDVPQVSFGGRYYHVGNT
ncbi:MAG: hypothetical protein ACE5IM_11000, partial [Nitrospinota bacterium]